MTKINSVDRRLFKGETRFTVFKQKIKFELENINSFIEEISEYISNKQKEIENSYDSAISGIQLEFDEEIDSNSFFDDDLHKYKEVFPKHYFNPLLLSIYGLFENWLKRLCDLDSKRGFSNVKVSDLSGSNYIEKSRKYLSIVADLDLTSTELDWQKIKQIQKVRNAIAHNDSNIKIDKSLDIKKQDLFAILKKDKRVELNENTGSFYIKDKQYLYDIINLIEKYLNFVVSNLSSRKVVAKNTTMPYNNVHWGQEKMENIVDEIIRCLKLLDELESNKTDFSLSEFKTEMENNISLILWDATKIFSFFCDGEWDTNDRDTIMNERKEGFEKIKKLYNK